MNPLTEDTSVAGIFRQILPRISHDPDDRVRSRGADSHPFADRILIWKKRRGHLLALQRNPYRLEISWVCPAEHGNQELILRQRGLPVDRKFSVQLIAHRNTIE